MDWQERRERRQRTKAGLRPDHVTQADGDSMHAAIGALFNQDQCRSVFGVALWLVGLENMSSL